MAVKEERAHSTATVVPRVAPVQSLESHVRAAAQQQKEKKTDKYGFLSAFGYCCMLRIPGVRSGDVCWTIDAQRQATVAAGRRRQQSRQQPVAASRSRKRSSVSAYITEGFPSERLCVLVVCIRTSKQATAAREAIVGRPRHGILLRPHKGHDR